jgi:hypothetical protein
MEFLALADDEAIGPFMIKIATSALLICIQGDEQSASCPSNAATELDETACIRASFCCDVIATGKAWGWKGRRPGATRAPGAMEKTRPVYSGASSGV